MNTRRLPALFAAGLVSVAAALAPSAASTAAPGLERLATGETVTLGWSRNAQGVRETLFAAAPADGNSAPPTRLVAGSRPGAQGAAAVELLHGQLWTRLTEEANDSVSNPPSNPPTDSREFQSWMLTDDPASQFRAYFPLLTYPLFLTRRVAGGAAGTELITVVRDHEPDHCSVWIAYPGPADGRASKDADVAFHPWDQRWDKPGYALKRIGLPAGRYVRLELRRREAGSGKPALWFVETTPTPASLDELDAAADAPLIAALRSAHRAARRAAEAKNAPAPACKSSFPGFSLAGA